MSVYTLATLRTLVYSRVENNQLLYTNAEVSAIINESLRVINIFTAFNETSTAVSGSSVADQLLYSVPTGIIFPTQVAFNGRVLDKIGLNSIAELYQSWATDTTNTYGPVGRWVPIGINKFAIHPIDAVGGNTILVTGVAETTQLSADGDVMELDDEFVSLVVDYCGHRLVLKEAGKVFSDASILIQTFWRDMKALKRLQTWKAPRYFVQVQSPS